MGRKRNTVTEEKQQNNEKQPKQAADNKEANKGIFSWSDDEIQLLLMAALDFKSQCESEEWTRSPKDLNMNKYFNDEAI